MPDRRAPGAPHGPQLGQFGDLGPDDFDEAVHGQGVVAAGRLDRAAGGMGRFAGRFADP